MRENTRGKPAPRPVRAFFRLLMTFAFTIAALALASLGVMALSRLPWVMQQWLRFDKVENPVVRRFAGNRFAGRFYFGFQLGVLKHVGRTSGRVYETPLGAYPFGDGFVLALFYGPDVDWARNVLAAGGGALVWQGQEYALERPEIISASDVLDAYPLWPRLTLMGAGTEQYLWLHQRRDAQPHAATSDSRREPVVPIAPTVEAALKMPQVDDPAGDGHMWSGNTAAPEPWLPDDVEVGGPSHIPSAPTEPRPF